MKNIAFLFGLFLLVVVQCFGQTKNKIIQLVTIPSSEGRVLHSAKVGADFNISIHFPEGYEEKNKKFPVLYILDGDNDFAVAIEFLGLLKGDCGIDEPILVAIGYGAMIGNEQNKRTRDYTPTFIKEMPGSGGAPKFLEFIEKELIPFIDKNYKANPDNRSIYGYSLGGLFTSYALFNKPGLFKNFLIGSPALWYDNEKIKEYEEVYAKNNKDLPAKVFMEVGQFEGSMMIAPNQQLYKTLLQRNYQSLKIKSIMVDSASHLSGKPISMYKALEYAYCKPKVIRNEITLMEDVYKKYTGNYILNDDIKIKIYIKDGKLFGEASNSPLAVVLHPETETDFYINEEDVQFTFVMNSNKEVTHFILHQKGQNIEVKKID